MRKNPNRARDRTKFIAISVAMAGAIFFIDRLIASHTGTPPPEPAVRQEQLAEEPVPPAGLEEFANREPEIIIPIEQQKKLETLTALPPAEPYKAPPWIANAVPVATDPHKNKVVIIIDDLGENRVNTRAVTALPGPLTLAYLPYPDGIGELVGQGRRAGHEIMVHMPMEAMDPEADSRPYVLRSGMDKESFETVFLQNLSTFDGYVGINNHMGSQLTQDQGAMNIIMDHLAERGLLFVDSRTIHTSIAAQVAAAHHIPYEERDVFLDHVPTKEGVEAALEEVERVAADHGVAVAIGHPKTETIEALRIWLPTLAEKNLELVPVSAVVKVSETAMKQDAAAEPVQ